MKFFMRMIVNNIFNRRIKTLLSVMFVLFVSVSLYAVDEYISKIYKQLDKIFLEKSENALNNVLSDNNQDKNYYLIENYTEKKIRRLIVNNDYDFAMTAIIIVIENNLDNEQAVEMYSIISEAYEVQKAYEAEQEQKRQLELARIEMEKEKQRASVDKQYVSTSKTNTGKSVYISGKETKLSSYSWKGCLGIIDFAWLMEGASGLNNLAYGISLSGRYEYTFPNDVIFGGDIFADGHFLSFSQEEKNILPLFGELEGLLKFATAELSKKLFFRLGLGIYTGKDSKTDNTVTFADTLITPILGLTFQKISLPFANLDIGADWYAGHLFAQSNLNFAMGVNMNLEFAFASMDEVALNLNIGLRDKIFVKQGGFENRASLIFAVGVENVVK
ncbi:MAG: hypothetical protein MR739_00190 [Spirochaetia bacterium]|nr:hypothetical protein [Spirochaetia bacterium]